jgi:carboxyl-terminal processing protease
VSEDFRGKQDPIIHRSLGYNVFQGKNLKMAILVDQGSASASEILSGALQQQGVAKLVGTRTFGKGSVQQLMDLGGGAELKVTIARWLTPNGSSISDGGLHPDIQATTTPALKGTSQDPQTAAAVSYLLSQ